MKCYMQRKKCRLWEWYKLSSTKPDFSLYCKAKNELCRLTKSLRKSYEERITSNI